ncbi:MAG: NAD(P)/FAD-dependent oxidoreductase [Promethearchaeota archaeon]
MGLDFVVVGAGHGGLVAAARLAGAGFNVKVLERNARDELSWDWYDNFDRRVFRRLGLPDLEHSEYFVPEDVTFVSPSESTSIKTRSPVEERDVSVERRLLVEKLLNHATDAGAVVEFGTRVEGPVVRNGKVAGVKVAGGKEIYSSLVVDSAGINTPVRPKLPQSYGVLATLSRGEVFHTYRGLFEKAAGHVDTREFKVYFAYNRLKSKGIAWVNSSTDEYADVLVGQIDPLAPGDVDAVVAALRKSNPVIGDKLLRGGSIAPIPVRRTLPRIVGDNYAAVGDAACMTVPLIGSGIENSMIAGDILARRLVELGDPAEFEAAHLWSFQHDYFQEKGAKMAGTDYLKNYMMVAPAEDIDFLLEKRVITADDMQASRTGKPVDMGFFSLVGRVLRGFTRLGLLLEVKRVVEGVASVERSAREIPERFEEGEVDEWSRRVEDYFTPFRAELERG